MPSSYHMIAVNIFLALLLGIILIFYKFKYPKKEINLFYLLIIILILPIISIFRNGVYESGDFNLHIYRTIAFYDSLTAGNTIPSWASNLNATYGYPLFLFNYSFPYYFMSTFHFFGLGFILSMKVFLATCFIFSGIFVYLFTKDLFENKLAGFIAAIFYQFSPYYLIDLHFKVTVGEIAAFVFIPLTFLLINRFFAQQRKVYFFLSCLSYSFLILSHVVIALYSYVLIFLFIIVFKNKNLLKTIFLLLLILITSLIITAFNWAPTLIYKDYLITSLRLPQLIMVEGFSNLFYSPWRFGFLFQGPKGQLAPLIGYAQLIVIGISLVFLILRKFPHTLVKICRFWLIAFFTLLFFISPWSNFFWLHTGMLQEAGSSRLLILIPLVTSILAGTLTLAIKNKKLIYFLVILAICSTVLNWGNRRMITDINDTFLRDNLSLSTFRGEGHYYANTKWVNQKYPWFSSVPLRNLEIIKGDAKIELIKRTSTEHIYNIRVIKPTVFKENTLYFPGWSIKSNNKIIPAFPDQKGIINFKLAPGNYVTKVTYDDILFYKIIKLISLCFFVLIIIGVFVSLKSTAIKKR